MIDGIVFLHRLSSSEVKPRISEVYRYAGISIPKNFSNQSENFSDKLSCSISDDLNDIEVMVNDSIKEISSKMNCRSAYIRFPLTINNNLEAENMTPEILFSDKKIKSHSLSINLKDCHSIYLFAATLGPEVDKIIQRNAKINPAKAVILQASAAMFIEEYCDLLQNSLLLQEKEENNVLKPRFSPGYADLPLSVQNIFFELLQCQKNLALTLNDSLIMSPEKSVTAFIGIKKGE